ncbi:retrotransposon protein, putative, unclassified [Tanacetum coccineum]
MINGYVKSGKTCEALSFYGKIEEEGVMPDEVTKRNVLGPGPNARVVYIDGAFNLFHAGHVEVKMDDPNITMEEYIRLEEEKSRRRGKVYNWETATYGKIWDNEDVHDLGSVESEFSAIVFNDTLTSEAALLCEPTVNSLNNDEIDFRISFDESEYEDCTRILGNGYGVSTSCTVLGPRERNINKYWWGIYKFGDLEVLES